MKWLLIVNVAIFLVTFLSAGTAIQEIFSYFALVPVVVVKWFWVWQLVTYLFLHGDFNHILWNMLTLWMFGKDLEQAWGTRRFLQFYFICGIGAGLCVVVGNYLFGNPNGATIGSSGAIYGILLAYAVLFPDVTMLFGFLIPIKVKYFVMIIGAIAFLSTFRSVNSNVSNIAHLGGMLFAYVYLKVPRLFSFQMNPMTSLRDKYRDWKAGRAKRRFQVYLRKQRSDKDGWVN